MEDIADQVGIFEINDTWSAMPVDYDADGDADLFIGYHAKGAKLWQNNGGTFERVAADAWPVGPDRHFCTWADVNADGRLDAYCTVGRLRANNVKTDARDNELWLQQADGTFVDDGTAWGVGDPRGRGRAVTFIDANGDEFPDLFVGNELPRADDADGGAMGENKLFLNDGGLTLVPAPEFGLHEFLGADCALAIDYDGDGWDDLFVCGTEVSRLYRNNEGTGFTDATSESGIAARVQRDADFGDLDGDGDLDAVLISGTQVSYQLFDRGSYGRPQLLMELEQGRAVALGDADGDGDVDIYVVQGGSAPDIEDALLLNVDLTFSPLVVAATDGTGGFAEAIDVDGDAIVEFVVLNGPKGVGPVQLLRLTAS